MVHCGKCGSELAEDALFCSYCGAAVEKTKTEEFSVMADNLVERVKELLHEGNITRIIVKDDKGNLLFEIPATIGVIGVVLAPSLAALGAIAAIVTNCKIVVIRRE